MSVGEQITYVTLIIFKQKRIDILLAVDLIKLAFEKAISCAAILTGDSGHPLQFKSKKTEGVQ